MSVLLDIRGTKVRPCRISDLRPGTQFLLPDIGTGDYLVGTLLKVTPGYAKVSVLGDTDEAFVPDKKKGGLRSFFATSSYETEWSRGTMVYPVPNTEVSMDSVPVEKDKKGNPVVPPAPQVVSDKRKPGGGALRPSNAVSDEPIQTVKEKIMEKVAKSKEKAAAKGAGNLKPKAKGEKKEKTPKTPTNICPGSGELVFRKFKPGMDARYYGWLKKIIRGTMKTTELPDYTRKHLAKVDSSIMRAIEKELIEHGVDVKALKEEAATE
jgi:hypothetical protein